MISEISSFITENKSKFPHYARITFKIDFFYRPNECELAPSDPLIENTFGGFSIHPFNEADCKLKVENFMNGVDELIEEVHNV